MGGRRDGKDGKMDGRKEGIVYYWRYRAGGLIISYVFLFLFLKICRIFLNRLKKN